MADIKSRGFDAAVALHAKRRSHIPTDPTVEEFCELYERLLETIDSPPNPITVNRYIKNLKSICKAARVRRIRDLDAAAIERFKESYMRSRLRQSTEDQLADSEERSSVRITLNGILRNAAAIFSKQLRELYRIRGLDLDNPFEGRLLRRTVIKAYSPIPRSLLERIWQEAPILRDGYREDPPPIRQINASHNSRVDFQRPNPAAYSLLLLELGLGLRRLEADRARWSWIREDREGRHFLEVQATDDFIPKSKESRIIPVESAILDALLEAKADDTYIVPAPPPRQRRTQVRRSMAYRCDQAHRVLVAWLQALGVNDSKPCHALRKEFGSYVATNFGLFQAQRLLGHSSPEVTSKYYAGLTELPELSPSKLRPSQGNASVTHIQFKQAK